MQCPRIRHFARLNHNGTIGKCGHMTGAPEFAFFEDMQQSDWLSGVESTMSSGRWPKECVRCQLTEETTNTSIRLDMIERDRILRAMDRDYLIVGGVLDNICNSACQTCHSGLSTKIGSLESKDYETVNNYQNFFKFPQHQILELDINGGEPSASPNYKKLLKNLPESIRIVRINTNVSRIMPEIENLLKKDIRVILTLSLDGIEQVHDYVRWPIKWKRYDANVQAYLALREKYNLLRLNAWTTVSSLNVADLSNIKQYADHNNIDFAYGFCLRPTLLDVRYTNDFTRTAKEKLSGSADTLISQIIKRCCTLEDNNGKLLAFVNKQDSLRNINYQDYFSKS